MIPWQDITSTGKGTSRMIPSTWRYDKYPNTPELDAGRTITLIDADGPGVISNLHISNYYDKAAFAISQSGGAALEVEIRIWYDGEDEPAIRMPLMDFLGDIQGESVYFSTIYFSKVRDSHNFRLPMPFRRHIRIEIENKGILNLVGYSEVQWEALDSIPPDCGHLRVDYRAGTMQIPTQPVTLWELEGAGAVAAHWLQFEADDPLCANGELLCEGNQEIVLDGEDTPAMEYLGTEDMYGFSWGFREIQSDFYCAILKRQALPGGGSRIALLRTRGIDRIQFKKSCRLVLNYTYEANHLVQQAKAKGGILAPYRSCVYWYG